MIIAAVYSYSFTDLSIESITSQRHRDHNEVRNILDELLQFDAIKLRQISKLLLSEISCLYMLCVSMALRQLNADLVMVKQK